MIATISLWLIIEKREHFVSYCKDKNHSYIWYVILEISSIVKPNICKQGHYGYPEEYWEHFLDAVSY